jgi:hypothetical protein
MVVSCLALFLALGGSAFALGHQTARTARCPAGTPRAIATVTGLGNLGGAQPGVFQLPDRWTSSSTYFGYQWSCSGQRIQVRALTPKSSTNLYGFDIRFPGNPGQVASVSSNAIDTIATSISVSKSFAGFEVRTDPYKETGYGGNPEEATVTIVLY